MEEYVDGLGQTRMLARLVPEEDQMKMRATMENFSAYLASRNMSLIPRSQWRPVSRRKSMGKEWVNDQLRYGACTCAATVQGFARMRGLRGRKHVDLSWAYLYDMINGGRDAGSYIIDALRVMQDVGVPLRSSYPLPKFRRVPENLKAECSRFRIARAYTLGTFDEIVTAIMMRGIVIFPIRVGRPNFDRFDGDGVPGFTSGPGNHAVEADGLVFRSNGEPLLEMPNSWNMWGPFKDGTCRLTERHIDGCDVPDDAYVIFDDIVDPNDPDNPPEIKS